MSEEINIQNTDIAQVLETEKPEEPKPKFNKIYIVVLVFVLVIVGGSIWWLLGNKKILPSKQYAQAYTLVNDTVSQNAAIAIKLPTGMSKEVAVDRVKFNPEIEGDWQLNDDEGLIVFAPSDSLALNKYYTVSLTTDNGIIKKDFKIAADPEVVAVFPKNDSEADENSEITIIFNRPMVPLTTLDILADLEIPIEISPVTVGKWKWIGTRTLQFIPESSLISSANYQIKIKDDFVSLDGLTIKEFEHSFTTRPLRYTNVHTGLTSYNQSLNINFNQPVNLEKTIKGIEIYDIEGRVIEIVAEHGIVEKYIPESGKSQEVIDKSIISIWQAKDIHGREKLWDFNGQYTLNISKAYPIAGDIILEEEKIVKIDITDIIKSVNANSERTNYASEKLFDPQGTLWFQFYENIDLFKTKIKTDNLKEKSYGKKCIESELHYFNSDCEEETDYSKVILKFDDSKLNSDDSFPVVFEEVFNNDGLLINPEMISYTIDVYKSLHLQSTQPGQNSDNASLEELYLCTTNPLNIPKDDEINDYIQSDKEFQFKSWRSSFLVTNNNSGYSKCPAGLFQTEIVYGLMPLTYYEFKLKIVDKFDHISHETISFKTQKMDSTDLSFYNFQNNYNVTTADKTSLTYAVENMLYVDMHICALPAGNMVYYLETQPDYWQGTNEVGDCLWQKDERIELEEKYWLKNYFQINFVDYIESENKNGHYVITFSHPEYKEKRGDYRRVYERTYLSITNLGVIEKKINIENYGDDYGGDIREKDRQQLENLYWVTNLKTMEPVADAEIEIFNRPSWDSPRLVIADSIKTNIDGIARNVPISNTRAIVVSIDGDSSIVTEEEDRFEWVSNTYNAQKIYMYTDRPIYRPGDEVHVKGIYRVGYDGNYEIFRDKLMPVQVYNSSHDDIYENELEISDYGTFNFSFVLDAQAALGTYNIDAMDYYGYISFDVQEYEPASFKIDVLADKEEYIAGDTLNLDIDAQYYFGAPVEGGEVEYTIISQNYYFDKYNGEYFSFGRPWYYCYYDCDYGDDYILQNSIQLDSTGRAQINQVLDFDKFFTDDDNQSKIFTVNISVKNSNGQTVSTKKSIIVHKGDYYLGIKTNKSFLGKGEEFEVAIKSVDITGQELAVSNINLAINKIDWQMNKRQEVDGEYYYRWEKTLEKISEQTIKTDSSGNWSGKLAIVDEGEYELALSSQDKQGNSITTTYNLYVWGSGYVNIQPSNDTTLDIIASQEELEVGEQASFIIKSPFEKAKALISIERGRIFEYEIIDIEQSLYNYRFDIKEDYIPNVYASVVLLSPDPEIKYGDVNFSINTKEKDLQVKIMPAKEKYLPGEEVVLDIEVRDNSGQGIETELSVAVVDLSVLALKGNPKKNPVVFFYDSLPLTVMTSSNLKNILHEIDIPRGTKGGGGAQAADLAKKKRGEFKDTAFWQADIITDVAGHAQVKFTLPDNLTTWQVESLGITKDTEVGVGYQEFIARKKLMLIPQKPRFIVPGDEFMIGAKVFNQTGEKQKLEVKLHSETLNIKNDNLKSISLDNEETKIVYFEVDAPTGVVKGQHEFVLSVKNDDFEDVVTQTIKITANTTYETTATSGYTKDNKLQEYIFVPNNVLSDKGSLTINHSATLAVFLPDALDYLYSYPYGCSEQIASKLEAIAIIKQGLNLDNIGENYDEKLIEFDGRQYTVDNVIDLGLARIYENQNYNGGFAYYNRGESNIYLTLHVLSALYELGQAGYDINNGVMQDGLDYVIEQIYRQNYIDDSDLNITIAYVFTQLEQYSLLDNNIHLRLTGLLNDEAYINEYISNQSLAYLAMVIVSNQNLFSEQDKQMVYNILNNRIEIDSRGSHLPIGDISIWQYYETSVKNTALLLQALVVAEQDNQILDGIMRWLLNSRYKDGAWGSTNNTLTVINAFTDYLNWQQETQSEFNLDIKLNDISIVNFEYNNETVLTQNSLLVPISDLSFDSLNSIEFNKQNNNELNNNFYYDLALQYYLPINSIPPRDEGFTITRAYYTLDDQDYTQPVLEAKTGEMLIAKTDIIVPKHRNFVAVQDFIPAGFELVNFDLDIENQSMLEESSRYSDGKWGYDWYYDPHKIYPDLRELRDDRLLLFVESLSPGTYSYTYYVRALIPGKYNHLPAQISEMYTPENFGRTNGDYFVVTEK